MSFLGIRRNDSRGGGGERLIKDIKINRCFGISFLASFRRHSGSRRNAVCSEGGLEEEEERTLIQLDTIFS